MFADSIASPALSPCRQLTEVPLAPWDPELKENLPLLPEGQCGSDTGEQTLTHDRLPVPQAWGSMGSAVGWGRGAGWPSHAWPASECVSASVSVA